MGNGAGQLVSPDRSAQAPRTSTPAETPRAGLRQRADLQSMGYADGQAAMRPAGGGTPDAGADDAIRDQVPSGVDLQALRLSFTLPKGKVLQGNWQSETRTSSASRVTLEVTPTQLRVWCNPGIHIDAQWPVQNMTLGGATYDFRTASTGVSVWLVRGLGEGFVDCTGTARESVTSLIAGGLRGTAASRPGYDPMGDPNIMGTLNAIASNFSSLPSSGEGGGVTTDDMLQASAGATIALKDGFSRAEDGSGVVAAPGATFDITVAGDGSLGAIARGGNLAGGARAAAIQSVSIATDGLKITKDGEDVIGLRRVRVDRGGVVTAEDLELLGKARRAADTESALRLLGGLLYYRAQGAPPGLAVNLAARHADAEIVPGLSRAKVERALTAAVHTLLTENANAVPGLNLAEIFGVRPDQGPAQR